MRQIRTWLAGEPKAFNLAILSEENVSYYVPSAIILDEKGRLNPLEMIVTNHTKKEHGFAIDRLKIKEVLKPGETKTIKVSVTDLDAIGTDRSTFKYYGGTMNKYSSSLYRFLIAAVYRDSYR